jgi:simple sugar transport system ATP-binding protein
VAVAQVSFVMFKQEVVALAGGNGSGKSTLLKIIAGVIAPDAGQIVVDDCALAGGSVQEARAHGIQMVFQDGALCLDASVLENMFLGCELQSRLGFLKIAQMRLQASTLISHYQLPIPDIDAKVRTLSGGQRKAVAIGRALLSEPQFLLLDEPTAALGVKEQQILAATIGELSQKGVGVIFCTHSPDEILSITSRVLILRRGELVADERTEGLNKASLALQMSTYG